MTATHSMNRLDGLDFARFIAFVGMVIVNFRLVISGDSAPENSGIDYLASLLEGRAAATFIVLAGVGLGLASQRGNLDGTIVVTLKRASFLLVIGLLNMLIFDADILHYYAFYFLFGVFLLPLSNSGLAMAILLLNVLSVVLILTLDYDAGWDWSDYSYIGFWTLEGFTRNLFFNGWHPLIPWLGYLLLGMILSRCTLTHRCTQLWLIALGIVAIICAELTSYVLKPWLLSIDPQLVDLVTTEAIPPMPLYMLVGMGTASTVIGLCLLVRNRLASSGVLRLVAAAGRQSLTLYIAHIIVGMGSLEVLGLLDNQPAIISLIAALLFCLFAVFYANWWSRRFKHGPVEALMRKLAG